MAWHGLDRKVLNDDINLYSYYWPRYKPKIKSILMLNIKLLLGGLDRYLEKVNVGDGSW